MTEKTNDDVGTPEATSEETVAQETTTKNEESKVLDLNCFLGVKEGMTRVYSEDGKSSPVTVVKLVSNVVSQVKTNDKDGYSAYQVAYGKKREKLLNNPRKGHLKKANIKDFYSRSYEVRHNEVSQELLGAQVGYGSFEKGTWVDATGVSKGKGFQGVIKRHGFRGGPASHGSHFHRAPGSIGNCATPSRVHPGKKMPGQMGNKQVTVQNLKVLEVDTEAGYMLIKGSIPGSKSSFVKISVARKKS